MPPQLELSTLHCSGKVQVSRQAVQMWTVLEARYWVWLGRTRLMMIARQEKEVCQLSESKLPAKKPRQGQ